MAGASFNVGGMKVNKTTAYISLAAAAGIVGYAWWQRQAGGSTPVETTTDTMSGIDPLTGLPYSDEFGFGGDFSGIGYSGFGFLDPVTGATIGAYGQTITQVSTNAAWTQAVVAYLVQQGYEGTAVTMALGKVFGGSPVTDDELRIWQAATASQGQPPQSHPPIIHAQTPTPTTPANPPTTVTGLKATAFREHIDLKWNPVANATGYVIYVNGSYKTTTLYSQEHVWNLRPNTTYRLGVVPAIRTSAGKYTSGPTATITVKTKR